MGKIDLYNSMSPSKNELLNSDGSTETYAGEALLPADADRAEKYKLMSPQKNELLNADGSTTTFSNGGGVPPEIVSRYVNVNAATPIAVGTANTEILRIPASEIVENYDYRFFGNAKGERSGGGENSRTTVQLVLAQGLTSIIFGELLIFKDDNIFLPIPQIAKRFQLNNTEDLVLFAVYADTSSTFSINEASMTIE